MARTPVAPVREVIAAPDAGPLYRLEYCDVRFWYPHHFHTEVEIKHVIRGSGTRLIGESLEPFEDDDLCVVGSGTPHSWTSEPRRGHWVRARVVQFQPKLFAPTQDGGAFASFAVLVARAQRGLHVVAPARKEALTELTRLFNARTDARQLAHLVAFLAILTDSSSHRTLCAASSPSPESSGARRQLSEQVLQYLRENYQHPLTEVAVARRFEQSISTFSRFFKKEFGRSFSRYIVELRVARASNLLLSETLQVRQIAEDAGFGTVASLNRHFRAVKMTTPTAYRRRGRELNAGLRAAEGEILRCDGDGRRPAP